MKEGAFFSARLHFATLITARQPLLSYSFISSSRWLAEPKPEGRSVVGLGRQIQNLGGR